MTSKKRRWTAKVAVIVLAWAGIACPRITRASIEYYDADGGFDAIWTDVILGSGSYFIGSSTGNGNGDGNSDGDIDTPSGNAWGLRNGPNSQVNTDITSLMHEFSSGPLLPGQTLRLSMDTGQVGPANGTSAVGFQLHGGGDYRFEFWYEPGQSANYQYGAGSLGTSDPNRDTGIPYTDEGLQILLTLLTTDTYTLDVYDMGNSQQYTFQSQTFPRGAGQAIDSIALFSLGNYGGPERNVYFNNFEIVPEPSTILLMISGLIGLCIRSRRILRKRT